MANDFCWYELMTSDPEAAARFYNDVVGWEPRSFGGQHSDYTVFHAGGRGVAGMMKSPPERQGMPPFWIGYVAVEDCDAAAQWIAQAGGTVHRQPSDIPEVGRFAVVADPTGASFIVMQPHMTEAPPRVGPMTPGHVGWHELYAGDGKQAFDFYASQFGWTADSEMDMGSWGTYRLFAIDGRQSGGIMDKPPQVPQPVWLYYFVVEGLDAAADRVRANGGAVINGPMEVPGGAWIVQATDPQGAMFALVAMKR